MVNTIIFICLLITHTLNGWNEYYDDYNDDELNEEIIDLVIKLKNEYSDDIITDLFATTHSLEKVARIDEFSQSKSSPLFQFKIKPNRKRLRFKRSIEALEDDERVEFVIPQPRLKREKRELGRRNETIYFNDAKFDKQWYLLSQPDGHDLNIKEAWFKGFSGKNITIVIIDDGLDHEHPDFLEKYVIF